MGIDSNGLSVLDRRILQVLIEKGNGGPLGLETLACLVGEDSQTIEEVCEPYLMRKGFLERTPRGRQIPHKTVPYLLARYCGQKTIF